MTGVETNKIYNEDCLSFLGKIKKEELLTEKLKNLLKLCKNETGKH